MSQDNIVTVKSDPIDQGWKPTPIKRTWVLPDGRFYTFPEGVEEKVIVFVGPYPRAREGEHE